MWKTGEREAGLFRASRGGDVQMKQLLIYIIQKTKKRKRGTCDLRRYGDRLKQARLQGQNEGLPKRRIRERNSESGFQIQVFLFLFLGKPTLIPNDLPY